MPDRAAHYALTTEAEQSELYSYRGSEHTRAGSGEAGKSQGAVSAWMGAKLWGGVGWLFGVQPYGDAPMGPADPEKGSGADQEKANPAPRRSLDEMSPIDLDDPHFPSPYASYAPSILTPPSGHDGEEYRSLFSGIRPSSSASHSSRRHSTGTVASSSPLLNRPLPTPDKEDESDLPAPPPPPKDLPSHGSSGSSQGAIVYVRMSDGWLVRCLSTIASMSEAGASTADFSQSQPRTVHRSRSTLASSGDTSGHGSGGSESFATAEEVLAYHRDVEEDQEVLILEGGNEENVEDWRQRNA